MIDATQTCEHPPESLHAFWITAVDIIGAPQRNPSDCPVARALNRITGGTWFLNKKSAWNTTSHQIYKMSPDLCWYIQRFDQGGSMDEQYFEWALMEQDKCET